MIACLCLRTIGRKIIFRLQELALNEPWRPELLLMLCTYLVIFNFVSIPFSLLLFHPPEPIILARHKQNLNTGMQRKSLLRVRIYLFIYLSISRVVTGIKE